MDVEIERSLARWDHLARLDTSWMCWLELFIIRVCGWPGCDLDLDAGRTTCRRPTRPDGLCRPGGRPGTPWPGQDEGDPTAAEPGTLWPGLARAWQVLLAGPWAGPGMANGWRAGRQLDGSDGGATDTRRTRQAAPWWAGFFFTGGVEIGRTRQREVWPLTSMASNYSPSRGHPESPHTK